MGHGLDLLFKLTVAWDLLGQTCENVFFFRAREDDVSDTVEEDVNVMINDTFDNIITPMRDNMSTDCVLLQSTAQSLNSPTVDYFQIHVWEGYTGAISSPSLPSYVAALISEHVGFSGRRSHGRHYLPGIPKSSQNGNTLTGSAQTILSNTANHWLSRYGRDGTSHRWYGVVFSRVNGVTRHPGPPPSLHYDSLAGQPWRTCDARSTLYTQRHRLSGRGI